MKGIEVLDNLTLTQNSTNSTNFNGKSITNTLESNSSSGHMIKAPVAISMTSMQIKQLLLDSSKKNEEDHISQNPKHNTSNLSHLKLNLNYEKPIIPIPPGKIQVTS